MRRHRMIRGSAEVVPPAPLDAGLLEDIEEWLRTRAVAASDVVGRAVPRRRV